MRHFIPSYDIFSHIVASACSHGSIIYSDIGKKSFLSIFYPFLLILVSFRNTLCVKGQIVDLDKHVEAPLLWF